MKLLSRPARCCALAVGMVMSAGASHAACANPTAPAGSQNFNTTTQQFEYCNNTDAWTPIGPVLLGPVTASTTQVAFLGIPPTARRITVMFNGVSTNGTSHLGVQLGDSGGFETTGYSASGGAFTNANVTRVTASSVLFPINNGTAAAGAYNIAITLVYAGNNTWHASGVADAGGAFMSGSGMKTLSDTLDRVRAVATNGTDTFDAGTVSILYE